MNRIRALLAGALLAAVCACAATSQIGGTGTATSSSPSASSPARTTTSAPAARIMLGLYSQLPGLTSEQSIEQRERQLGRTVSLHHSFYSWGDTFPGASEADDAAHGRTPVITWWGYYYSAINNGSQDALIRARADAVRDYRRTIYLAWGPEMNLAYPPWPNIHNPFDPAGFVAAWRRIHTIFQQEGASNVIWVWAPNSESRPGGVDPNSANNWKHYYPGDAYVDWVGTDGYNWGHYQLNAWRTLASLVGDIYRDYAAKKPFMILETAANSCCGAKDAWFDESRVWMKSHPGIQAFVYFDQRSAADRDWRIDAPASALAAFRSLALDPAFRRAAG